MPDAFDFDLNLMINKLLTATGFISNFSLVSLKSNTPENWLGMITCVQLNKTQTKGLNGFIVTGYSYIFANISYRKNILQ